LLLLHSDCSCLVPYPFHTKQGAHNLLSGQNSVSKAKSDGTAAAPYSLHCSATVAANATAAANIQHCSRLSCAVSAELVGHRQGMPILKAALLLAVAGKTCRIKTALLLAQSPLHTAGMTSHH
jgi:hypothetical protein